MGNASMKQEKENSHGLQVNQRVTENLQLCIRITEEITGVLMTWHVPTHKKTLGTSARGLQLVMIKKVGSF